MTDSINTPHEQDGIVITAIGHKKVTIIERIKRRLAEIRMEKPFLTLWVYKMWVNVAFIGQGLAGVLTLGFAEPRWTTVPSVYLSAQRGECNKIKREERKKQEAIEKNEEYIAKVGPQTEEEEFEAFMKQFTEEKVSK